MDQAVREITIKNQSKYNEDFEIKRIAMRNGWTAQMFSFSYKLIII